MSSGSIGPSATLTNGLAQYNPETSPPGRPRRFRSPTEACSRWPRPKPRDVPERPRRISPPRSSPLANAATMGDLLKRLGNIPAERVRLHPSPGTATEKDVLDVLDRENRPCELVEGTLVEKAMGYEESEMACISRYVHATSSPVA